MNTNQNLSYSCRKYADICHGTLSRTSHCTLKKDRTFALPSIFMRFQFEIYSLTRSLTITLSLIITISHCNSLTHSLTDWLTHSLTPTDSLTHSLTHYHYQSLQLTYSLTDWLTHSLTYWLSLTVIVTHSITDSLTHWLTPTHWLPLTVIVTHSLTQSFNHIHWLTSSVAFTFTPSSTKYLVTDVCPNLAALWSAIRPPWTCNEGDERRGKIGIESKRV